MNILLDVIMVLKDMFLLAYRLLCLPWFAFDAVWAHFECKRHMKKMDVLAAECDAARDRGDLPGMRAAVDKMQVLNDAFHPELKEKAP